VHTINRMVHDVQEGTQKAKVLGEAIGEIGDTVHRVHGLVRSKAAMLAVNATGLVAGVKAAVGALARGGRSHHPDGGAGI
jgi:methyl-accepting chemotaxis protein